MDRSSLPGVLCLLLLVMCGCNDPGFALRRAAYDDNRAAAEKILKAHPELVNDREKPLPVAVFAPGGPRVSTEWVDKLFTAKDKDFFDANRSGMTPLHLAVSRGQERMVELLIKCKADVNATNWWGQTPLLVSLWRNPKPTMITLLLDAQTNPTPNDAQGQTPLHMAILYNNTPAAEMFLKRGADVNVKNIWNFTPLHYAAMRNQLLVRLLLDYQAAINDQDARGNTALHHAARNGQIDIIEMLLGRGADANAVNQEGFSPLFQLIQLPPLRLGTGQKLAVIELLLAKHAQVNVTNMFGRTLFQDAIRAGDTNVVNRLRESGATK